MTDVAGSVPASPNRALDDLMAFVEKQTRPAKWHEKYAGAIMSGGIAVMLFVAGIAWNARAEGLKEQAAIADSVKKITAATERLTELVVANREKNEAQDKRLDQGYTDRMASQREQDAKLSSIETRLAVVATKLDANTELSQRLLRKMEEGRSTGSGPFDQGLKTRTMDFPFVLKANGTVSNLRLIKPVLLRVIDDGR